MKETQRSSLKAVFDALTEYGNSSESCDSDWCHEILERASPEDVAKVRDTLAKGGTESEAAHRLGIWPR